MEPGRVVEFIEGRRFITAVVSRPGTNRLQVLSETDREMSVSSGRLMHVAYPGLNPSQSRNDLVRALREISARRARLSEEIGLVELWELLEGEGEEFDYAYLAELCWPAPVNPDQVAAAMRAVFNDGLYFKMGSDRALRHSAEKVEQILLNRSREEQKEKELSEGGEWLRQAWADAPYDEPESRDKTIQILKEMAVFGQDAPDYKLGQKLLERAGLGTDPWKPFDLLVKLGEYSPHQNLEVIREQISLQFPPQVLAEAEEVISRAAWRDEERKDLTDLNILTADSGGARDFDDAVSLETKGDHFCLGVHIADVSAAVRPGTALDLEALERATSIYMPDMRLPMLPECLSEEMLSLRQGLERPAFSLLVDLTDDGEILDYQFTPSVVKIRRQLSYQEVDESVATDLMLIRLRALSKALKARRVAQGALILPLPKLNVYLTPEGELGVSLTLWDNPGRAMITEFMVLANHLAARYLMDNGAACYYRCQDEPTKRVVSGDTDCQELFPCLEQRRFLHKVSWSLEQRPHSGMGLECYTNLTSPLRRYIDLAMQRQVRSVAAGGSHLYSQEDSAALMSRIEIGVGKAMRVQFRRRRYWLLRWFELQGKKEFEALVLEKHPRRWRVYLTELMMDVDLPDRSGLTIKPGDCISVRVQKVVPRDDVLRFELA